MSSKGYKQIVFNVVDESKKVITNLTSINIYKTGTTTAASLYADAEGCSSKANPITSITDNGIRIWIKQPVDIIITLSDGSQISQSNVFDSIGDIVVNTNGIPAFSQFTLNGNVATSSNVITKTYTIGVKGVAGCDYNYTSVSEDTVEEGIEIENAIPAFSKLVDVALVCVTAVDGSGDLNFATDIGSASGGNQIISASAANEIDEYGTTITKSLGIVTLSNVAQSVFVSGTPTANWSTLTGGKWMLLVTYIDYSKLF